MKRKFKFGLTILTNILVCAGARGDESVDVDFRVVLTNVAQSGYDAASLGWDAGTMTLTDVVVWSRRLLDAQAGRIRVEAVDNNAADAQLQRINRIRTKANVSLATDASLIDFEFQIARAVAARSEIKLKARWSKDIVDIFRLQGRWQEDAKARIGNTLDRDSLTIEIVGGVAHMTWGESFVDGFIDLDAGKTPKEIDFFGRNFDYNPSTCGIYQLDNDALRISCRHDQPKRPADFSATATSDFVVYRFIREKPAASK